MRFDQHDGFFESVMGDGQNQQGQGGDEQGNGDENYGHLHEKDLFENLIGDEGCGNFVSYGGEEMLDVQRRITSFFVMRDLVPFWLREWNYWVSFGIGFRYLYM